MAIKSRGELIDVTDQVNLTVQFKDSDGYFVDADSFPQISIVTPSGTVAISPTSAGVAKISTGKYSFIFTIPINGPYGVFNDIWTAYIAGDRVEAAFSFVVLHTQVPGISIDGYVTLGQDPGFNYSQAAIKNINKLLKSLKARLNSSGKSKAVDSNGNTVYIDCDAFSIDTLVTFLASSLWDFNQVPFFTNFTFDDDTFITQFGEVLVEHATLQALSSKALIERGAEFSIADNGLTFNPPTVSDMMMTQYNALLTHYYEKLKYIKNSLRPGPLGLGLFGIMNGTTPFRRLRHLRARRIM